MTEELNEQFGNAVFLGAKISDTFLSTDAAGTSGCWRCVLVAAMTVTTFTTQRQLMSKNMPADALTGPYAQQQKLLLYVLPRGLRRRWHRVPDRRPLLLDHLQPVDDGPAVLRDPQQPGTRDAGLQGQAGPRRREGAPQGPAA